MIELPNEIKERLDRAIEDRVAVTAAYVNTDGKPRISFYGSTHVHDSDALALWVRKPESDLIQTIPERPHVALIYGDISSRFYANFTGRARVATDPEERERIYQEMHEIERRFEPDMKGVGVVIELDRVTVMTTDGMTTMER